MHFEVLLFAINIATAWQFALSRNAPHSICRIINENKYIDPIIDFLFFIQRHENCEILVIKLTKTP